MTPTLIEKARTGEPGYLSCAMCLINDKRRCHIVGHRRSFTRRFLRRTPHNRPYFAALPALSATRNATIRRIRSAGRGWPRAKRAEPLPCL